MDRRTFLKAAGCFALLLPGAKNKAFAQSHQRYAGPFLLCLHAGGGWDTTMFLDPKAPYVRPEEPGRVVVANRAYGHIQNTDELPSLGPFRYAPVDFEHAFSGRLNALHGPEYFLSKYRQRLLLLNGVDTQTNAHPVGEQMVWSGRTSRELPALAALLALKASSAFALPCAFFVNNGSYTNTLQLVPLSLVNEPGRLTNIAYPERMPGNPNSLFSEKTRQSIQLAHHKRLQHLRQQLKLPESQQALGRYSEAVLAQNGLEPLVAALPPNEARVTLPQRLPGAVDPGGITASLQQAELALCGFASGTMASASVTVGGFDSHANNDSAQRARLGYFFVLLDYVLEKSAELGLDNALYVLVGSDFARPPEYNSDNGKDHWNATSLMVFGPNIPGNRVLGKTADNLHPAHVNPHNPAELLPKAAGGLVLKPAHLHLALRRVLGLSEFNASFPLFDEAISVSRPLEDGDVRLF